VCTHTAHRQAECPFVLEFSESQRDSCGRERKMHGLFLGFEHNKSGAFSVSWLGRTISQSVYWIWEFGQGILCALVNKHNNNENKIPQENSRTCFVTGFLVSDVKRGALIGNCS
jgi:hypothetical protein